MENLNLKALFTQFIELINSILAQMGIDYVISF